MSLQKLYDQKKASAADRNLDWSVTLEEFTHLWNLRDKVKCGYSGRQFIMSPTDHMDYPTLERIKHEVGYRLDNILWGDQQM